MTLDLANINQTYRISSLNIDDQEVLTRMAQFGLNQGAVVRLMRRAPLFNDPLLIEVGGGQIVISKDQAKAIGIESE